MLPTVSIGIPAFNRAHMLPRAVRSVVNQTYAGAIEINVVDDGSTDETLPILMQLLADSEGWRPDRVLLIYLHEENLGIAISKNRALRLGHGPFRGILDSDNFYHETFVERCASALLADPMLGMVYTDNALVDPAEDRLPCPPAGEWSLEALLNREIRGDCYLARWSVLERTALHDERFELELDYDLYYQLLTLTTVRRIPEALMSVTEHRLRSSRDWRKAAYWHAAALGKYGHPIDAAYRRAGGRLPDWKPIIDAGYAHGARLGRQRAA